MFTSQEVCQNHQAIGVTETILDANIGIASVIITDSSEDFTTDSKYSCLTQMVQTSWNDMFDFYFIDDCVETVKEGYFNGYYTWNGQVFNVTLFDSQLLLVIQIR